MPGPSYVEFDLIPNFNIGKSKIHGNGVLASKFIKQGDFINTAIIKNHCTRFGAYLNHSDFPNAETRKEGDVYKTYSLVDINRDDEITVDYRRNKDLEQPYPGWKLYNEAVPNNGVETDSRPRSDEETYQVLIKKTSYPASKDVSVRVDEKHAGQIYNNEIDVEEDDIDENCNSPQFGSSIASTTSPEMDKETYLSLLKNTIKVKGVKIKNEDKK